MQNFFIDTETTGLDVSSARLTEIACMKETGESFQQLVNPQVEIPEICVSLNGISNEKVANEPKEDEALKKLLDWIDEKAEGKQVRLIAHNSEFDEKMIRAACERHQIKWPYDNWYCTLKSVRINFPEWKQKGPNQYNLSSCIKNLELPEFNAHRALADVEACKQVYEECLKRKRDSEEVSSPFIKKPKNQGKPWTEDNIKDLISYFKEGTSVKEITEKMERSEYSITCMLLRSLLQEKVTLEEGRKVMNIEDPNDSEIAIEQPASKKICLEKNDLNMHE
jgi:DNA polymerase III epsilon subunit-like protein